MSFNPNAWTFSETNYPNDTAKRSGAAGQNKAFGIQSRDISGAWYFEVVPLIIGGAQVNIGVALPIAAATGTLGADANSWGYNIGGNKANAGVSSAYGSPYVATNVIGVLADFDNNQLSFSLNGVSQGVAFANIAGASLLPAVNATALNHTFLLRTNLASFSFFPGGTVHSWSGI